MFLCTFVFFKSRLQSNMTPAGCIFYFSYTIPTCVCLLLRQVLCFKTYQMINVLFLTYAYSCSLFRIEFIPKSAKNNSKQTPEYAKRDCACYSKADHQIQWSVYWIRA